MKEVYKKPAISVDLTEHGAVPALLAAAAGAAAASFGIALAKGKVAIDSNHTQTLTARKDFKTV